jgi:uncharacterized repeat protein (TIGR01451 family)
MRAVRHHIELLIASETGSCQIAFCRCPLRLGTARNKENRDLQSASLLKYSQRWTDRWVAPELIPCGPTARTFERRHACTIYRSAEIIEPDDLPVRECGFIDVEHQRRSRGVWELSVPTTIPSIPVADLDLTMIGSPDPVREGDVVTYTMKFTNKGFSDAVQGFILDYIPSGFTFLDSSGPPCGGGVGVVLCNLGPVVPAGYTWSFQVRLRVPSNFLQSGETSRVVTNEARITSHTLDPDAGDGPALVTTTVVH